MTRIADATARPFAYAPRSAQTAQFLEACLINLMEREGKLGCDGCTNWRAPVKVSVPFANETREAMLKTMKDAAATSRDGYLPTALCGRLVGIPNESARNHLDAMLLAGSVTRELRRGKWYWRAA